MLFAAIQILPGREFESGFSEAEKYAPSRQCSIIGSGT